MNNLLRKGEISKDACLEFWLKSYTDESYYCFAAMHLGLSIKFCLQYLVAYYVDTPVDKESVSDMLESLPDFCKTLAWFSTLESSADSVDYWIQDAVTDDSFKADFILNFCVDTALDYLVQYCKDLENDRGVRKCSLDLRVTSVLKQLGSDCTFAEVSHLLPKVDLDDASLLFAVKSAVSILNKR